MCNIDLKFNLDSYLGALGRFLDPSPIPMLEEAKKRGGEIKRNQSGIHTIRIRIYIYTRSQHAAVCRCKHMHVHTQPCRSALSDTSACSAADRQAPSDTNHQAEEVLSPNLSSGPPSFHLSVTLRGVVSTLQGVIYPRVS